MPNPYYKPVTHTLPMSVPTRATTKRETAERLGMMTLGGLLLALGFPNDLLPGSWGHAPHPLIAWLALVPLFIGLFTLPPRAARWGVWLAHAVFFLIYLHWITLFGVGLMGVLIWVALALVLALLPVLALWLTQAMPARRDVQVIGFALAFTGVEWLRGQGTFGFPLAELGSSQVNGLFARVASVGGTALITFLMLLLVGSLVLHILDARAPRWLAPAALALILVALMLGVWQSTAAVVRWEEARGRLRVALVQPCVVKGLRATDLSIQRSWEEWQQITQHRLRVMTTLSYAAVRAPSRVPTLIIWPESALPQMPYDVAIANLVATTGSHLLLGAPYWDVRNRTHNAAYLMRRGGMESGRYEKIHLVPFGEFVPFRKLVAALRYDVRGDDIVPGARRTLLHLGSIPLGVGICFESTFAGIARTYARDGARLLVYLTNDAWFLRTAAIEQHFGQSRLRALETGLPVARTASTGISALIAPDGRVLAAIPVDVTATRTRTIPLGHAGTLTTAGGWLLGPVSLLLAGLLAGLGMMGRKRKAGPGPEGPGCGRDVP